MRFPKPARKSKPRKRLRRQRKTSLAALKRKLWAEFSAYVKARDGNVCISCGRGGLEGSNWHAGHLFSAGAHSLIRYHPKNVHSQCFRCNVNLGGNGAAYANEFWKRYGMDEFTRLFNLGRHIKKWTAPEVRDLIDALTRGGADYECLYAERYLLP